MHAAGKPEAGEVLVRGHGPALTVLPRWTACRCRTDALPDRSRGQAVHGGGGAVSVRAVIGPHSGVACAAADWIGFRRTVSNGEVPENPATWLLHMREDCSRGRFPIEHGPGRCATRRRGGRACRAHPAMIRHSGSTTIWLLPCPEPDIALRASSGSTGRPCPSGTSQGSCTRSDVVAECLLDASAQPDDLDGCQPVARGPVADLAVEVPAPAHGRAGRTQRTGVGRTGRDLHCSCESERRHRRE